MNLAGGSLTEGQAEYLIRATNDHHAIEARYPMLLGTLRDHDSEPGDR